ncbi:hypothetical protein BDV3_006936 [Batrachochytrium dendrobatidis]
MSTRTIHQLIAESNLPLGSFELAEWLDSKLPSLRSDFCIPKVATVSSNPQDLNDDVALQECVYLCGNSLGLQPLSTRKLINEELDVWQESGVHGHFRHRFERPWVSIDDHVIQESCNIVGAEHNEVVIMNSLTANLHFLMVPFYRPTSQRFKILLEHHAFPSDHFALETQAAFHGYDPKKALIQQHPRSGEFSIRTEDILETIEKHGDEIALVLFSGLQYYTGQWFDMPTITAAAKAKGCIVGWDLAHAVGGIGGAFIHNKHIGNTDLKRFAGWWGSDPQTKFDMNNSYSPIMGANSYRLSNPCVLAVVSLYASLNVFAKTSMTELRKKSLLLTGYLEMLLDDLQSPLLQIITPRDSCQRGCQLSLLFTSSEVAQRVFCRLDERGVVCDERKPDVIRIAPTPLYNTFADVHKFVNIMASALEQ